MTKTTFDLRTLRPALLELHKELLEAQRIAAERFDGRMSSSEVLQAAADDLRFGWLRTISELISELDDAVAADEPERVDAAVSHVSRLLAPPHPDTAFGRRYLRALQEHPGVVLAHRDVVAALPS